MHAWIVSEIQFAFVAAMSRTRPSLVEAPLVQLSLYEGCSPACAVLALTALLFAGAARADEARGRLLDLAA